MHSHHPGASPNLPSSAGPQPSVELHRAAIAPSKVEALSDLLDEAIHANPDLKASVAILAKMPASRKVATAIIDWFWKSGIPELYRRQAGADPMLMLEYTTIRRHTPGVGETRIAWHIDANFVGFGGSMGVAWVPVDTVGVDAPGLEFALPASPIDRADITKHWQTLSRQHRTLSDEGVTEMYGGIAFETWRPVLAPGDLLMFDQWVVHRTDPTIDSAPRTAIEFRMFSPSDPPQRVLRGDPILMAFRTSSGDWLARPASDALRYVASQA